MKEINFTTRILSLNWEELTGDDLVLAQRSKKAASRAYAPYSGFKVGASLLLDNSEIVDGANQENAAFPSGLCAERVAAFYAGQAFPKVPFIKMAIYANTKNNSRISPCGACLQSLLEYEGQQGSPLALLLATETEVLKVESIKTLLPLSFDGRALEYLLTDKNQKHDSDGNQSE